MAVLRITESQYESILLKEESDNLYTIVNGEYAREVAKLKVGDFMHLAFGKLDDADEIDKSTESVATFVIKEDGKRHMLAKFLGARGAHNPFEKNQLAFILKQNAIDPVKGFYRIMLTNELGDTTNLNLPNFLGFTIDDSLEGGQLGPEELETMIKTNSEVLDVKWNNFKGKAAGVKTWEPGFMGMDNAFFHPTGFMAADEILSKYGMGINKDGEKSQIKFRIQGKPIIAGSYSLKVGAEYVGKLTEDNQIIVKLKDINFVLQIQEKEEVVRGGRYLVTSKFMYTDRASGDQKEKTEESSIYVISLK